MENEISMKLEHLRVGYHGRAVVEDITCSFRRGEIITLIGPNGAGKSTVLKTITRQLSSLGGRVYYQDRGLEKWTYAELSKRMAVVLTERLKTELMTCRDVVSAGRYPYTGRLGILSGHDEEIVDVALRAVHAEDVAFRDYNAVSDGQRQRVLLARAIAQEPETIILDEPTSFLDIHHKLGLLAILRRMAKEQGITIIMSLHEIDLAMKISDRILGVKDSRIFRMGTPAELFRDEVVAELYDIEPGCFDTRFGSIELPPVKGEPEVFVISSCGRGIPVFRRLQREGIPFAAGILYENDMDFAVAERLAVRVIREKPFEEIKPETLELALKTMAGCRSVINAGIMIGSINAAVKQLLLAAEKEGKLTDASERSVR